MENKRNTLRSAWQASETRRPPSWMETIVLDLLAKGEKYGLEMVRESGGEIKRGTVYTTLQRLERKGLISSRQDPATDYIGIPRRLYVLTQKGRDAYDRVQQPASAPVPITDALKPG